MSCVFIVMTWTHVETVTPRQTISIYSNAFQQNLVTQWWHGETWWWGWWGWWGMISMMRNMGCMIGMMLLIGWWDGSWLGVDMQVLCLEYLMPEGPLVIVTWLTRRLGYSWKWSSGGFECLVAFCGTGHGAQWNSSEALNKRKCPPGVETFAIPWCSQKSQLHIFE